MEKYNLHEMYLPCYSLKKKKFNRNVGYKSILMYFTDRPNGNLSVGSVY